MKLPNQAQPVARSQSTSAYNGKVTPSDSCGCPHACIGACVFGHCAGACV